MSEWRVRRPTKFLGVLDGIEGAWRCRTYELHVPGGSSGLGPWSAAGDLLDPCLEVADSSCLSDEFLYLRVGAFLVHFGRRGVTVTLIHFGCWGDMPEVFICGWYAYARSLDNLELLDNREPVSCYHDAPVLTHELDRWRLECDAQSSGDIDWEETMSRYLASPPFV